MTQYQHHHITITIDSIDTSTSSQIRSITISQPFSYLKMRYSPITASLLTFVSHREVLAQTSPCECGYTVNATTDSQFAVFTDYFESDLLHNYTETKFDMSDAIIAPWVPQAYNAPARNVRGRFGESKQLDNVIQNPLPGQKWGGEPVHIGDAGMQLWVRHELKDNMAPVAETTSPREDMLYGSFRAAIKFTGANGTCGTFSWLRNDTQEIDMAFYSKSPKTVNLVTHSPDAKSRSEINIPHVSAVDLPQGFHEYRFDWMPDRIDFYLDGSLAWTTTENIPSAEGRLMLNHLSNGNPEWSGGPPVEDAVMTVAYVKAYFNTTSSFDMPNPACGGPRADTVCVVPDQTSPPEPKGKTHFYAYWHEEHKDDDNTFTASGSDMKSDHSTAASFGMSGLVWTFVGAVCSAVYCLT